MLNAKEVHGVQETRFVKIVHRGQEEERTVHCVNQQQGNARCAKEGMDWRMEDAVHAQETHGQQEIHCVHHAVKELEMKDVNTATVKMEDAACAKQGMGWMRMKEHAVNVKETSGAQEPNHVQHAIKEQEEKHA